MSPAALAVLAVVSLLTGVGVLLLVLALAPRRAAVATTLTPASTLGLEVATPTSPEAPEEPAPSSFWRRVTGLARPAAQRLDVRRKAQGRPTMRAVLSSADVKLREDEFLVLQVACALLLAGLAALRFGVAWPDILFAIGGWLLPGAYVGYRRARRRHAFEQQLGETLMLLAGSLRAGHSLSQALDTAAQSMRPPVGTELERAVREMALGLTVEQALANVLHRMPSRDFELFTTAVAIQYRSGGNLAEVLEGIAGTISERVVLKGEIRTLTAQARASGVIISLLPVAVVAIMFLLTPSYFNPMIHSTLGIVLLAAAGALIVIGNLIIRRIVNIEGVR